MNADQVKELLSNATPSPWNTSRKDMDTYTCREDGQQDHVVYVYRNAAENQPRIPVFAGPLDNARADARLIAAVPDIAALAIAQAAEIERLRGALERVEKLQVGWWEEVIALMDPDADSTPALEERADVLKRVNHQLHAVMQDNQ